MERTSEEVPDRRSLKSKESPFLFRPPNLGHPAKSPGGQPEMIGLPAVARKSGERQIAMPGGQSGEGALETETARPLRRSRARGVSYLREKGKLENRIAVLGKILEFFGPDGAVLRQANACMKAFQDTLNRRLSDFGYTASLVSEPFEIRVTREGSDIFALPLRLLSASERFRFGIAFQIALAEITGVRLVVIDGADVLDNARRRLLTALLMRSEIDQAIVLATGEGPAPAELPRGVKFFSLAGAES